MEDSVTMFQKWAFPATKEDISFPTIAGATLYFNISLWTWNPKTTEVLCGWPNYILWLCSRILVCRIYIEAPVEQKVESYFGLFLHFMCPLKHWDTYLLQHHTKGTGSWKG